ncbi:MAG: hypothetical protein ACT4TC_05830 [Myxococcaceae bacterium]
MDFRFFALPAHRVMDHPATLPLEEGLEPQLPEAPDAVDRAFSGSEFRDRRARDRLRSLLHSEVPPTRGSPGKGWGPSAIFAQPPSDLPALLRLADQLDQLAQQNVGERAMVWRCECGTRYAVPVSLVRNVSIRCERCERTVELAARNAIGEEALVDPCMGTVNSCRRQLAEFFREAMARGWPVLVSSRG